MTRRANLSVVSLFAASLTGCGFLINQPPAPAPTAAPSAAAVTSSSATPGAAPNAPAAPVALQTPVGSVAGGAAAPPAAPTYQTTATIDGKSVVVQILELKRTAGNMLTMRVAMTNQGGDRVNRVHGYSAVIDTYLVDPAAGKKYEVIKDKQMSALASEMSALELAPGSRQEAYAQYAAPPASTVALDVHVRGAATPVTGVPITP